MPAHNKRSNTRKGNNNNNNKKHRPINGNAPNGNSSTKAHGAIICRIFPQARDLNAPPAKVQILLQKRASDGHYEFLNVPLNEASSRTQAKYALRRRFDHQCGSKNPQVSNQPETPPLLHADAIEVGAVCYWVFLLPTVFNNWIPDPSEPTNQAVNFVNEDLKLAQGVYKTHKGHVWVDVTDLSASCVPGSPIAPTECQLISTRLADIGKVIMDAAKKDYQRYLLCGSADATAGPVLLVCETAVQIKFQADYKTSTFKINLVNMDRDSTVAFILKPITCPNPPVLNVTSTSFPPDQAQNVNKNGTITLTGNFQIGNYFSYADLPVVEFLYQTKQSFHRIRFRLPLFVFRCGEALPFHTNTDAAQLQTELQNVWGLLPQEFNIQVKMGKLDDAGKLKWLEDLKKCGLPVCTPLPTGIVPVVMKLGDAGCLFLLNITDGPDTSVLNVSCKYSEPKTFESLLEVIYGISSATAGMEISLLNLPPQ